MNEDLETELASGESASLSGCRRRYPPHRSEHLPLRNLGRSLQRGHRERDGAVQHRPQHERDPACRTLHPVKSEEWQEGVAKARKQHEAVEARMREERRQQNLSDNEKVQPIMGRYLVAVNLQRQYQKQMPKKLRDYHEVPDGSKVTSAEWKASYQDIGHFSTAALLAYHYQLDTEKGIAPGPYLRKYRDHTIRLDIPRGDKLRDYFNHRGLSTTGDELRHFEGCISKKVDFPVFLVAAVEDNLNRVSKTDDNSLAAHKNLLIFILEDDLIREEITEVLLVSMAK
ncbi:hypothetical protein PG996_006678 [Apiospora saccharicola]|uniref:Uncharacterized protein n=1 Tax=Apiospora saccharicola TaxID=335842 RepID=A0ABR1VB71_9PEZI